MHGDLEAGIRQLTGVACSAGLASAAAGPENVFVLEGLTSGTEYAVTVDGAIPLALYVVTGCNVATGLVDSSQCLAASANDVFGESLSFTAPASGPVSRPVHGQCLREHSRRRARHR